MKNLIFAAMLAIAAMPAAAQSLQRTGSIAYSGYLSNETGLTYTTTFYMDLNSTAGTPQLLSAQVVFGSATYTTATATFPKYPTVISLYVAAGHGFTTALPVLYASTVAIGGLTNQTTYFVVVIDANNVQLATTSSRAVSSLYVTITSTATSTLTLAPLAITGTPAFKWQASNDGLNFTDLTSYGTMTLGSYFYPSTSAVYDFGAYSFRYLRLSVTGPTTGGIQLKTSLNAKKNGP